MYSVKLKQVDVQKGRRIFVTSDIHGHLSLLQKHLEDVAFSQDDILFIVGDIVEKGPESLKTLRYVMDLCRHGNVIALIGNVDLLRAEMIYGLSAESAPDFYRYLLMLRSRWGTSFFDELAAELGYQVASSGDMLKIKDELLSHFSPEFAFLQALPTIVETKAFTFVHGGLRDKNISDNLRRAPYELLKYDSFLSSTPERFDKYVIVGHWPVCLYGDELFQLNPIIDREKKIISIDGGCGVKKEGQLNLLLLPHIDCNVDEICTFRCDDHPHACALSGQDASTGLPNHISWPNNEITLLQKDGDFSQIVHNATGRRLCIPTSFLLDDTHCRDYTDYRLPVLPGDRLSIIEKTARGYLVKKDGVVGWYLGEVKPDGQ